MGQPKRASCIHQQLGLEKQGRGWTRPAMNTRRLPMNKVVLIGRLGADPVMKYMESGNAAANLRVATSRFVTGQDGVRRELTEWHDVVCWGKTAEAVVEYTGKGSQVSIEGRIQTRSWDGQDGQKHYRTEIVAESVEFLSRKVEHVIAR